jgi:(S)-2-hydroxy-acid oxidase
MRDVSNVDTSVDLLGGKFHLNFPICLAPTASQRMAHPDGEMATSRASADMGTIMIASTIATTSLENIARAAPDGLRWFQLYVYKDRKATEAIVRRVEKAGYKALVVTIDTAVAGNRRNDARNSFALPSHLKMENFVDDLAAGLTMNVAQGSTSGFTNYVNSFFDSSMTWSTIDWLKSITSLPVMVKGLLTAEDAELACQHGVEGIIVSNHGARQCDSVPATVEALPEVVQAVDNRCDVYIDGGIRSGNDVFKALALGAKLVFVGRPYLWGLAYDGEAGVKSVINVLKTELQTTMALAGCKNMHDVQTIKKLVVHESNYASLISKL